MAPNKFATMLNRNTNKISMILIYAVLEWILIALLLLNSLFSYLIIKFAKYFGLKPPCLWCTRLDHIFDPAKRGKNLGKDLLCEAHSKEISKLGYCLNHQKLVESQEMCEDCLSSRPELNGFSKKVNYFSRVRDFGMSQMNGEKVCENGEVSVNCSCCGVGLDNGNVNNDTYSSYVFLKTPSWDVLECARKKDFALDDNHIQEKCDLDKKISHFAANLWDGEQVLEDSYEYEFNSELDRSLEVAGSEQMKTLKVEICENKDIFMEMQEDEAILMEENSTLIMKDKSVQVCVEEEAPIEISSPHLEFFLDHSGQRLVPIELIDSIEEHQSNDSFMIEHHGTTKVQECGFDCGLQVQEEDEFVMKTVRRIVEVDSGPDVDINAEPEFQGPESVEIEETKVSEVFHAKNFEEFTDFDVKQIPSELASEFDQELEGAEGEKHSYVTNASEDFSEMVTNENEADISIGTEIPELDITDEMQNQVSIHSYEAEHHGPIQIEEQMVELKALSVQETDHITNNQQSFYSELYEIEEDKVPDTPTSVDSLNHLHKKLLLLEKKESGAEESIDGSVTSELENGDGIVTVERLKSALRAERKNLQALYAELEEERSASAVAANQTMAMINRLQEEKAAMQMEALQYQRMMDEQTEYDQEALELLNELMVKREKEKLELEKELEMCKKKVLEYEAKEKMRISRSSRDGSVRSVFSSGACSNSEDSDGPDGLSIDLNQEIKEEGLFSPQQFTSPVDAVTNLEECLADFEEERFSILEQLKMLEEKLVAIDETEDSKQDNGNTDLHSNGCLMNGKNHPQRRICFQTGKSLLPLFNATVDENDSEVLNGDTNMIDSDGMMHNTYESKFGTDDDKVAIEEEVDHLYQRLQAFEADREFLKHCVSSLKKGDKGVDLLQEILQHLRDLRNVEFRARNLMEKVLI
ncbi:myosin-binding protein 2-like isoform X1 [Primulina huaijiensis]|uniref:myosin-binding protein 2-like isoform X1 n=1 Tax=Primulina huaijiensis TaxID=1492673 RepID=UPI003CC7112B